MKQNALNTTNTESNLNTVEEAIADLQAGNAIIVVDDEDRENEGDLLVAAEFATPEMINFMAREARGLICITMRGEDLERLGIPMMVTNGENTSGYGSPFTVSVEASSGVTTGISAGDRARTVQVLTDPNSTGADIAMPGHMFPLRAHPDGVLARRGHTEAGVDLTTLAGLQPASVICEIMNEDGTMARLPQLLDYAAKHDLKIISIEDLVRYRQQIETAAEPLFTRGDTASLPTRFGNFEVTSYVDHDQREHLLIRMGDATNTTPLVRLHSECLTGDVLGSLRCDCGEQIQTALYRIAQEGAGMVVYLRQEGRGIGLANKISAYALQDQGMDTVEANLHLGFGADERDFAIAAAILKDQGVSAVRLMSNNPRKISGLATNGIRVVQRVPHQMRARPENQTYLQIKAEKLDHQLEEELLAVS